VYKEGSLYNIADCGIAEFGEVQSRRRQRKSQNPKIAQSTAPEKSPCTKKVRFMILPIAGLRNLVKYRAGDANGNPKISKSHNQQRQKRVRVQRRFAL